MPEHRALDHPNLHKPWLEGATDPAAAHSDIPARFPWLDTGGALPVLRTRKATLDGWDPVSSSGDVHNVLDYGAVPNEPAFDNEPVIQALLDDIANGVLAHKPVYFPIGVWYIRRPLRLKGHGIQILGQHDQRSAIGGINGHGPIMVGYAYYTDTPEYSMPLIQSFMEAALVTGPGNSFRIARDSDVALGAGIDVRWLLLRPDTMLCELDNLAALCVEFTVKVVEDGVSEVVEGGVIIASSGALYADESPDRCFRVHLTGPAAALKLAASINVDGTTYDLLGTTSLVLGGVYHVALDYDGTTVRLFLEGVEEDSAAAAGPLVQQKWEHVGIGPSFGLWPELGNDQSVASVLVDAVRLSRVSRYSTGFTPPATKWGAPDPDTLVILNFDEQFDPFTTGRSPSGDVYLFYRTGRTTGFAFDQKVSHIHLAPAFVGSGTRSGLILYQTPRFHAYRLFVSAKAFALLCPDNIFQASFVACTFAAFRQGADVTPDSSGSGRGSAAFAAFVKVGGLSSFLNCHFDHAAFLFITAGGQTLVDPFFNTSSQDTLLAVRMEPHGAEGALTLINMGSSQETGGLAALATMIVGGPLNLVAGGMEHWARPAIILDRGKLNIWATEFRSFPDNPNPVITVRRSPVHPALIIGAASIMKGDDFAAPLPWSDSPKDVMVIGDRRVRPVIEGCSVNKDCCVPVSGELAIDAAERNQFTAIITDNSAFEILTPVNGTPGQRITITIQNRCGGAMGTITWGLLYFMSAWTNPADVNQRSITFQHDGVTWNEVARTPADVPLPNFVPSDFPDLVGHWEADALALSDADPVASWPDASAEGNDLVQATGGKQPTFQDSEINGLPVVRFDGIDDALSVLASAPTDAIRDAFSLYILFRQASVAPAETAHNLFFYGDLSNGPLRTNFNAAGHVVVNTNDAGGLHTAFSLVEEGEWQLLGVVFDKVAGTLDLFRQGILRSSLTGLAQLDSHGMPQLIVGGDDDTMDGDVAAIILFARAHSSDIRIQLEQYLARKYALLLGEGC